MIRFDDSNYIPILHSAFILVLYSYIDLIEPEF